MRFNCGVLLGKCEQNIYDSIDRYQCESPSNPTVKNLHYPVLFYKSIVSEEETNFRPLFLGIFEGFPRYIQALYKLCFRDTS